MLTFPDKRVTEAASTVHSTTACQSGAKARHANLSTVGGSYLSVKIEGRFGEDGVWVTNPAKEGNLSGGNGAEWSSKGATGWVRISRSSISPDPRHLARFFSLDGKADLKKIDSYFEKRLATDTKLQDAVKAGDLSKASFRTYYGLRASGAFSYGSHDEWISPDAVLGR